MSTSTKPRLTRDAWLEAGFEVLANSGGEALKAEPLARHLNTTKGSFYWHFKDVPTFHTALLARWQSAAIEQVESALAHEYTATSRLRKMAQVIGESGPESRQEPAIRAWATGHSGARAALGRVDAHRLGQLQEWLRANDIGNPEMARIIYAAAIGMKRLGETERGENARAMGSLVDLVLALR